MMYVLGFLTVVVMLMLITSWVWSQVQKFQHRAYLTKQEYENS